jgi:hypothetical protein
MTERNLTPPPPRAFPAPPKAAAAAPMASVRFGSPNRSQGHRVVLYGPGGIGKTTLAAGAPGPVAFVDLDDSLGRLGLDAQAVTGADTWAGLRAALQAPGWDGVRTVVIDSLTKAEELAVAHTLLHVPHEKGHKVSSVEDYGFGKGLAHVFDTVLPLLSDLDAHARAGRNVVLICHDCTANVPNPAGEDWLRYEPRLQSPSSGKNSIRLRVREWADHVLFLGYDVAVRDGKGLGGQTRTLYPSETAAAMAKSRTCRQPFAVGADPAAVWAQIIR